MNQLEYLPGIGGAAVQLDGPSSFVGIAENLRSREWEYDLGYRDLVSATRPAREVDVTFHADYATADDLRRVADADVTARTPGIFIAQKEWRQRGYVLASKPSDIHFGRLSTELKVALLDGAWWRLVDKTFAVEDTTPTYESATGKSVTTDGAANVPLHALTVDGEAVQDGTPTPDAPVDIQVVEPRNLCDTSRYASSNATAIANYQTLTTTTISGLTFTRNSDGSITVTGTNTNRVDIFLPLEREIKAGETVTLTGCPSGGSTSLYRLDLYNTNSAVQASDYGSGITKTTSSDSNRLRLSVYAGTNWYLTFKPQLEVGSTATPYVPYGSIGLIVGDTATPIPLQGNVLASFPDGTRDVLTVDGAGHVTIVKNIGTLAIDSCGAFTDSSTMGGNCTRATINASRFTGIANVALGASNSFCNCGVAGTTAASVSPYPGIYSKGATSNGYLTLPTTFTSKSEVDAWMAESNVIFYYPLAEPEEIDLGYIDMPNVFDGAVVSITAEVTPTITAEWQTSPDLYLDYPHDYQYDYQKTSYAESITPSVLTPSDVHLVIYGPAVNPYVIVGGNRYQVNVTVPSGGYLIVDGRDKTIMLTLADGTVQNVFSSGVRGGGAGGGTYIFEKVPAGTSEVTYDGSFGFDLGWYEEEGEPPWNQS